MVEEIPFDEEPYDEDDKKYMQEAIDICEKSKDKNTKVSRHITCIRTQKAQNLHVHVHYRLEAYWFTLNMQ